MENIEVEDYKIEEVNQDQRRLYYLLAVAIPLIIFLLFLLLLRPNPKVPPEAKKTLAQNPSTQEYTVKNNSELTYNQQSEGEIQALTKYKVPLSADDEKVKLAVIKQNNPLSVTDDYTISYNAASDKFQVTLTTISIDSAKLEAVNWFENQGFSDSAICELPVEFIIDQKDADSLRGLNVVFDPLPPGC
jgi:hypothetical protein